MDEFGVVTASRLHDPGPEIVRATYGYREGNDFLVRVIEIRFTEKILRGLTDAIERELSFKL